MMVRGVGLSSSVTALFILISGVPLTYWLQISGALISFLLGGLLGGASINLERTKGKSFLVGLVGSTAACVIELLAVPLVLLLSPKAPQPLIYVANHVIWLMLGSPVNLMIVGILISGFGGALGGYVPTIGRKVERSGLKNRGDVM